ncbi:MAG: response regulator transcription factor [Bilifractor sp.]|jgi:DNA-binding response OmpR family regulator
MNRALTAILEHEGYAVDPVFDGNTAFEHIQNDSFDVMILDIMMPGMSGIEVLKNTRKLNITTPVLLLTAKAEIDDRVDGLDAGADDYLTKPFSMKELLARVRALVRRNSSYNPDDISYQDIALRSESFELVCENTVRLSVKEFELLHTFLLNPGKKIDTAFLIDHVWGNEPETGSDTVRLYISFLNRKLEAVVSKTRISGDSEAGYTLM